MKKTVLLLTVLVASLCFALAGCNDTPQAKAISIFDDSSYILPITPQSANWHGNGTDFVSDLTLEEIKNEINKQSSTIASIHENCLLIENQNGERTDFYVVERKSEKNYDLSMPYFISESGDLILYPKHFFHDELADNKYFEPVEEELYRTDATFDDFKQFYEKTGVFHISQKGNSLVIAWNKEFALSDGETVKQGGASFTIPKYQGSSFAINFFSEENELKISYSITMETD